MPNLQIAETIENNGFCKTEWICTVYSTENGRGKCISMHQAAATKQATTSPAIFLPDATTPFLYKIRGSSSYHHIIIAYHLIGGQTGTQSGQYPTQRGGDYRGGIYTAK